VRPTETGNRASEPRLHIGPLVLCGLPVKRPPEGCLLHERRNGQFVLQVTGHPSYGLPWGQDRLVPIFLATLAIRQQSPRITFDSAAELLDTFGMQQGGSQYRRLIGAFQRIFGAIFFGTDTQSERAAVVHRARFNFMTEARIFGILGTRSAAYAWGLPEPDSPERRIRSRDPESPDSKRSGGGQGPLVQPSRARPVHVAFLPLLHGTGERACAALQ
jgi:hypothetical protein